MKGVILAGGLGTRLLPLTKITNKHLLPVYDRPMIYYPILAMVEAGIRDVVLVTGGNHSGDFMRLLGDGHRFGLRTLHYVYQEGEGGIAQALSLVQHITQDSPIAVLLGDNLFEKSIKPFADRFRKDPSGALIALKAVKSPERFGVATVRGGSIVKIVEKPSKPVSKLAVTGLYFYDSKVFEFIRSLKPSRRGELEITDVNNAYIAQKSLRYGLVNGWWTDCGTFESLFEAGRLERELPRKALP
jgi:glucose-1-phosphate thymidylyltransferase